jgi:hypothetical protein
MWKVRRNHHIMISKKQPRDYENPPGTKFSGDKIVPQSDLLTGTVKR